MEETVVASKTPERVYLDVGGKLFETFEDTILRLPYFSAMKSVQGEIVSSRENPLFFDRNPDSFEEILEWLRDDRYPISERYKHDLDFWGVEKNSKDHSGIRFVENTYFEPGGENSHIFDELFRGTRGISCHIGIYNSSSLCMYLPSKKRFETPNWEISMKKMLYYSDDMYIILPLSVPVEDYHMFRIDINFGSDVLNKYYTLDVLYQIQKGGFHTHDYEDVRLIKLHFFPSHNSLFLRRNNVLTIKCSNKEKKYENCMMGLNWSSSEAEPREIERFESGLMAFHIEHLKKLEQLDIGGHSTIISNGLQRYIVFKYDGKLERVCLTKTDTKEKIEYDELDFKILEPKKVRVLPMDDGWGVIYFCLNPHKYTEGSGGLLISSRNVELSFHFSDDNQDSPSVQAWELFETSVENSQEGWKDTVKRITNSRRSNYHLPPFDVGIPSMRRYPYTSDLSLRENHDDLLNN